MSDRLQNKVAVITGGASGIGEGMVRRFCAEGAKVILADVNEANGSRIAVECGADFALLDVSSAESWQSLEITLRDDGGRLDILVNNAAVFTAAPIAEIARDDYQKLFDINVAGTLFTMQAVARQMIERGTGGKIINMASQAGRRGEPLVAVYCATKAAVISLTQSAGLNLIEHGINVNAISPGVVDGEHWDGVDAFFAKYENKAPGQKKREVGANVPFGRMGRPEDLAGMAVFLASDASDYVVAQTYNVDGGQWMS